MQLDKEISLETFTSLWRWWLDTLAGMTPAGVSAVFAPPVPVLLSEVTAGRVRFLLLRGQRRELLLEAAAEDLPREAVALRERLPATCESVVCLPREMVLSHRILLPGAVESRLEQVLQFEIDRFTPFARDQVRMGYRVVKRHPARDKLEVELAVVRREELDALLASLDPIAGHVRAVFPPLVGPVNLGALPERESTLNLLPAGAGVAARGAGVRVAGSALAIAACLVLALGAVSWFAGRQLDQVQDRIAVIEPAATEVAALRNGVIARLELEDSLVRRKNASPGVLDVLLPLTEIFPDDTWVSRLQQVGNAIELRGESANAFALIGLLDASPMFREVRFSSPVNRSRSSEREQYVIEMELETHD